MKYDERTAERKEFSISHGLVGQVVQQQKGYIINDIKYSSYYNELVDIKSILPIYALPILSETIDSNQKSSLGVIEFTLKNSFKSIFGKDQLIDPTEGLFSPDMNLTNILQIMVKNIALAIHLNQHIKAPGSSSTEA